MEHVDTLIHARWVIPVEPDNAVLEHHSVAILDGRIIAIHPRKEINQNFSADVTHELDTHALIPGLVNTHTHSSMSLFRGLADDLPLMEWLNGHIWPAEGQWVNSEFVRDGSQLAIAEMIKGGTTCFNDMYFFPNETAKVASESHMRACVGMILIDFPTVWAANADEYISKGLKLHDEYRNHPLITTAFAPHAPYTVSDEPLSHAQTLAEQMDIPIHMHVHETAHEVTTSIEQHQKRPLARLDELNLLSDRLLAVHMTQVNDEEIQRIAETGTHVIHCPESNMKLASGFSPIAKLLAAGVNVALGTDGAASNNDLDMLSEMRSMALIGKAVAEDASAIPAATALRIATLNGAKALGIDNETGSLTAGKAADITAIDLSAIATQPVYHAISQIVYAASRDQVTDVWISGKHVLNNHQLTTLNENDIKQKARAWRDKIAQSDAQQ